MKGFKLDLNGDVVIENGDIAMIQDSALIAQTCRTVLGTNQGEWPLNIKEGINFSYILGKGITEDMVLTQVQGGIKQVDPDLYIDNFEYVMDKSSRTAHVAFSARDSQNNTVVDTQSWS